MYRKCLLILGGGVDQIPGILKAKEMGIYTIVLDGNPDSPGKEIADEFYTVSIKHREQIEDFIRFKLTKKVDGVIAFGVDIPSIIAKTADMLNVNYTIPLKNALLSEDKFKAKEFMKKNNIAVPKYSLVDSIEGIKKFIDSCGLPVVLKPIDNSAARGINYINSLDNLEKSYNCALKNSPSKHIQVERYLDGHQVSTESFVIDGKVHNIAFLDRNYGDMKKFLPNIIENGGDMPSIYMKEKHKQQLKKYLEIISNKLNIKNGIIKGDIVIHNDKLYIIEFALRLSGGNFSTVCIPESTGVDFIKIAIFLHLNYDIKSEDLKIFKKCRYISMRYKFVEDLSLTNAFKVKKIKLPANKEYIVLSKFHIKKGDIVSPKTTDHAKRLGFAIATGDSREDAIKNAENFLDRVEILFE